MAKGISLVVVPVTDAARARATYTTLLGVDPYVDQPYYIGFRVGSQEVGLDPNGHKSGLTAPLAFCEVEDIEGVIASLQASGSQVQQPVKNVGGGRLVASVKDGDGNVMGLMQNP